MKHSSMEREIFYFYDKTAEKVPDLDKSQWELVKESLNKIRQFEREHHGIHFVSQLLPYIVLIFAWVGLVFFLKSGQLHPVLALFCLAFVRGNIGYQWVIYGMHEGAGHGLFRKTPGKVGSLLRFLTRHSCRLFFADAGFYHKAHPLHHRYLGQEKDSAFTQYVFSQRILKTFIPGAGILFPNDYCIHRGEDMTPSLLLSFVIGLLFLSFEVYVFSQFLPLPGVLLALSIGAPWVGLSLDRIRESLEHHFMPIHNIYGSRQMGLGPLYLWISGGPWGQPCHFCHHLGQDLTWYQQIWLHLELKSILSQKQKKFLGFEKPSLPIFLWQRAILQYQVEKNFNNKTMEKSCIATQS